MKTTLDKLVTYENEKKKDEFETDEQVKKREKAEYKTRFTKVFNTLEYASAYSLKPLQKLGVISKQERKDFKDALSTVLNGLSYKDLKTTGSGTLFNENAMVRGKFLVPELTGRTATGVAVGAAVGGPVGAVAGAFVGYCTIFIPRMIGSSLYVRSRPGSYKNVAQNLDAHFDTLVQHVENLQDKIKTTELSNTTLKKLSKRKKKKLPRYLKSAKGTFDAVETAYLEYLELGDKR